jgi:hypothetical protein
MTAYVDESLRLTGAGLYLVTAAVVINDQAEQARHRLRKVLTGRQDRFHWNDAGERQRGRMLETIVAIGPVVMAYACSPLPTRQDRARGLCVRSLVWDLQELDVRHVTFESRQDRNDRKDADTIERARRARAASPELTYAFSRPRAEPLLWVADALAGAISAHVADANSAYLDRLSVELLTLKTIEP